MLDLGRRTTHFTPDEQRTLMTLWSIARSPLIMGGDLTKLDAFTLALLTNEEVIAVDQHSSGGHQLFNRDDLIGWAADAPGAAGLYLALFNARDGAASPDGPTGAPVAVSWRSLASPGRAAFATSGSKRTSAGFPANLRRRFPGTAPASTACRPPALSASYCQACRRVEFGETTDCTDFHGYLLLQKETAEGTERHAISGLRQLGC